MKTDQVQGKRTPNGASDLLDDGVNDASTDQATPPAPIESGRGPTVTEDTNQDAIAENNDDSTQEREDSAGQETKLSIAAVSAIVDSIVKHKQSHNDNSSDEITAIVHREIDRYYDQEQGHDENMALVPHAEGNGKNYAFSLDDIHGEGGLVEENQRAPYQDGAYGEQPPMFLLHEETTKPNPTNVDYKPEKEQGVTFQMREDQDDEEEYDNIVAELGVTPQTHPQYFQRKRYKVPVRILHNEYCQVCLIVTGLVILSLSIAALVTKGFETVKRHEAQLHTNWQVQSASDGTTGSKEKLDWWLDNGGNGLSEKEFESLAYSMEDSYLPIWFDRKTGWEGQTYQEAVDFCANHDEFMPCPYEVYCPGKTGKLIEGTMDDGISWAPIRDETNGWVQVGAGGKECGVYLESDENQTHPYKIGVVGKENEEMTRHIMCCLQTPLSDDIPNDSISELDDSMQHGDVAQFSPNLDLPESPANDNSHLNAADVDKWYLQQIMKKYNPRWFDRESKWDGTTYQDAVSFCYSVSKKVPCPYSVYCPKGPTGSVIFNLAFDDGESWAATGDRVNQFVQVGKKDECNRVTAENPPGYDENNGGIDVMSHLMCCDDDSSGDSQVPQTATNNQSQPNSGSGTTQHYTLTELEHAIKNRYIPFWFGFKDGWNGSTYDAAVKFCESVDPGKGDNFHLCPLAAYCPNGPAYDKPLFLQKEAFEGEQWSPTSFAENSWIQVGQLSKEDPRTCTMYLENYQQPPDWGLDGSEPGLKQHILCCKGGSPTGFDFESDNIDSTQSDTTTTSSTASSSNVNIEAVSSDNTYVSAQGSIQGMPLSMESSSSSQKPHMGTGNSSPHGGTTTHEAAMVVHLRPVWYDHSQGWNGGSHSDAESFCNTQGGENPMTLCPYDAYCPKGPSSLALGGLDMSFATEEQYAPYHGGDDHWVLIGRFNNARTTTCLDYYQLFGEAPSWGSNDSNKELKQYLLCCATSETLQVASNPVALQSTTSSTIDAQSSMTEEDHPTTDAAAGIWYGISDGWKGGSHTDAIIFCNSQADEDGVPMELCPYEAYCPNGPSKPTALGNTYLGINEELEQWSPTLSKGNHWVLVGSRGMNDSTTCLDTWQLDGDDNPSWGLDGSNNDHKHHLMCCPLT